MPGSDGTSSSHSRGVDNMEDFINTCRTAVVSVPKVTKVLVISLALSFVLSNLPFLGPSFISLFALIPGFTLGKMCLWNLFTFAFLETSFPATLISILSLLLIGKWLESDSIWGSTEYLIFILINTIISGTFTYFSCVLLFGITQNPSFLFDPIHGFASILGAFTVAVRQSLPEYDLFSVSRLRITPKYLPLFICTIHIILALFGVIAIGNMLSVLYCCVSAWTYLRFFQVREGLRGDPTPSFTASSFFPEPLASMIAVISSVIWKLFSNVVPSSSLSSSSNANVTNSQLQSSLSNVDSLESDRRKSRALKALDERLLDDHGTIANTSSEQPRPTETKDPLDNI